LRSRAIAICACLALAAGGGAGIWKYQFGRAFETALVKAEAQVAAAQFDKVNATLAAFAEVATWISYAGQNRRRAELLEQSELELAILDADRAVADGAFPRAESKLAPILARPRAWLDAKRTATVRGTFARSLAAQGKWANADTEYGLIAASQWSTTTAHVYLGLRAAEAKNWAKAEDQLRKAIQRDKDCEPCASLAADVENGRKLEAVGLELSNTLSTAVAESQTRAFCLGSLAVAKGKRSAFVPLIESLPGKYVEWLDGRKALTKALEKYLPAIEASTSLGLKQAMDGLGAMDQSCPDFGVVADNLVGGADSVLKVVVPEWFPTLQGTINGVRGAGKTGWDAASYWMAPLGGSSVSDLGLGAAENWIDSNVLPIQDLALTAKSSHQLIELTGHVWTMVAVSIQISTAEEDAAVLDRRFSAYRAAFVTLLKRRGAGATTSVSLFELPPDLLERCSTVGRWLRKVDYLDWAICDP
jgi:tetratricopeptide (TPR) repeat protein